MKKPFLFALGLATVAACGGKVVVDAEAASGNGGAGGTTSTLSTADGSPNTTSDSSVVSVGPSTVAATTGSGMSCDPNYTCAEAITEPEGDPSLLCENTLAAKVYFSLLQCMCVDACAIECGNNVCAGEEASTTCKACVVDSGTGCGNQFVDCANNL